MDPPYEVVEVLCPGCQELELYTEEKREKRKGIHLAFRPARTEEDQQVRVTSHGTNSSTYRSALRSERS